MPYSSRTGQSSAAEASHDAEHSSKEPQQESAVEAPDGSIVSDAQLVFEAAAAVGARENTISRAMQQFQKMVHGMHCNSDSEW